MHLDSAHVESSAVCGRTGGLFSRGDWPATIGSMLNLIGHEVDAGAGSPVYEQVACITSDARLLLRRRQMFTKLRLTPACGVSVRGS